MLGLKLIFYVMMACEIFIGVTTKITPLECQFMHVGIGVPAKVSEHWKISRYVETSLVMARRQ